MSALGHFVGVGVGPGPAGLIPVAALAALQDAEHIYLPRARGSETSVARQCLTGLPIPEAKFCEIEFQMDPDRSVLSEHYGELADAIAAELRQGHNVAYLTIGDSMTYSTYGYLLAALRDKVPGLRHTTYPGVTSFAATASALSWPLGEGKERILILPCPDDMAALRTDIESHDIVVLMKIGARLPAVLQLLNALGIAGHCAFARRIGLPGEVLCPDVSQLVSQLDASTSGYLATMLIRRTAREKRHA